MSKPKAKDYNQPVLFRPGDILGRLLDKHADGWSLTRLETARRLAVLCAFGLSVDLYPSVIVVAKQFGGDRGFEPACGQIRSALEGAEMGRRADGRPPMNADERANLVVQLAQNVVNWIALDAKLLSETLPTDDVKPATRIGNRHLRGIDMD